jgi:nucleoside-diphosphate-sugar epimerase
MTILVTGATGFVMSAVVRHLAERGHDVVAADAKPPDAVLREHLSGLRGRVEFRQIDVTDRAAVGALVAGTPADLVVHGAAITAIPPETERARFVETTAVNVLGTLHLLEALRPAPPRRTVVVSSGSIYGARADRNPVDEDAAAAPQGVYPMTKWAAEALARRHAEINGLDLAVVRLASPFGPFERDTGSRPLLSAIRDWSRAALRGEALRIGGPPTALRDVAHVDDVASGIAAVLLAGSLAHDVYNVGWGKAASTAETVAALVRLVPGAKLEVAPDQPSRWPSLVRGPLSADRLRRDLAWSPAHDLDTGLAAYLEWLRRHPDA